MEAIGHRETVSWPLGSRLLRLLQSEMGRERTEQSETEEQGQQTAATELGFDGGGSGELADGPRCPCCWPRSALDSVCGGLSPWQRRRRPWCLRWRRAFVPAAAAAKASGKRLRCRGADIVGFGAARSAGAPAVRAVRACSRLELSSELHRGKGPRSVELALPGVPRYGSSIASHFIGEVRRWWRRGYFPAC